MTYTAPLPPQQPPYDTFLPVLHVAYGYSKCALHDLRRLIGDTAMAKLLKDYVTSHW